MNLPKRKLGSSGMELTTVGFGTWAMGGGGWAFAWGPQDDAASLSTMRHALELGVNWIDTAAVYGLGHSEDLVGKLLRELSPSERPFVFTKCGVVWDPKNRMVPSAGSASSALTFTNSIGPMRAACLSKIPGR